MKIVIAGATATGKTNAAISLAKRIGGEIISADSMQIYKYMNIGTAKPSSDEMQGVPHHLIDELFPDEAYNVAVFKEMAESRIVEIERKAKIPIIAGGTGFYINALIKGTEFNTAAPNGEVRAYYERELREKGASYLYDILLQVDSKAAESIHRNNTKRVIRALEYFGTTGTPISSHNEEERRKPAKDTVFIVLDMNRDALYERINQRVDNMIEKGLVDEVKALLDMGYRRDLVSMQGIGYKEIVSHLMGECTLEEAVNQVKKGSRNYAKRQVTWFRHQAEAVMYDAFHAAEKSKEFCDEVIRLMEGK